MSLEEKERLLKEVEKEREVWRQRDHALAAVLQEKEALIRELVSSQKGGQVIYKGVIPGWNARSPFLPLSLFKGTQWLI